MKAPAEVLPKKVFPTVKTGKGGDATQQKQIRREHSVALISPRSQSSAAVFAPTGKPKRSPDMRGRRTPLNAEQGEKNASETAVDDIGSAK